MGFADFVTASLILAGAVYLLYRSIWKKKGFCHGCASGACRPPPRDTTSLVRLGQPRRPAAGGAAPPRAGGSPRMSLGGITASAASSDSEYDCASPCDDSTA